MDSAIGYHSGELYVNLLIVFKWLSDCVRVRCRLYNTGSEPEVRLLQVWQLGRAPIGGITSSAKLPMLGGLGETAVDFDFAPPVVPTKVSTHCIWPGSTRRGC